MSKNIDIVIQAQDKATGTIGKVKTELTGLGSGLSGTNNAMASLGSSLSGVGKAAMGFTVVQAAVTAFTTAVAAAGSAMITYNAKMEQAAIGFQTMLGSAEAAQTFIAQLSKMAAETPFEFPQLQQASQKMLAFGFAARDVIPTLTAVGNAAAGLGIGAEGIQRMTIAIGQMKAKGTVQGDELLQLAEAGVPAYQILAEKMNLTADQVRNIGRAAVSADDAIKALVEGMNERFPDMMKRQSDTAIGMFSTIKDNMATIIGETGQPAFDGMLGPLRSIRDVTNEITDTLRAGGLQKLFEDMIPPAWQDRISKVVDVLGHLTGPLTDQANASGKILKGMFDAVGAGIDIALPALDLFTQAIGIVWSTVADMVAAVGQYVSDMVSELTLGWEELRTAAVDKFGGIYDVIVETWTSIGDSMGQVWEAIKSSIWEQVSEFVNGVLDRIGPLGNLIRGVGNSLSKAWTSVGNMSTSSGSGFRSWLGNLKKPASETPAGLAALANHKGTPTIAGGGEGGKESDKLARQMEKIADKIGDSFDTLNQKILGETRTTYQVGMAKIKDEVAKIQREIVDEGNALGLDTSALSDKMAEYGRVMAEPVKRAWRDAWTDLKNESAKTIAQLTGDKKAEAAADEAISLAALEKERREKLKAVQQDENDAQALAAVQAWYETRKQQITMTRLDAERQAKLDEYAREIETNGLLVSMHSKTHGDVDKLNRKVLDAKIKYLNEELTREGLTAEQILAIRRQLAEATTAKESTPLTKDEGIKKGLQDAYKSFGTEAQNWVDAATTAAKGMQSSFQNFFFDAMTGQLKSLSEYFTSFLKSVASAFSQLMANMAAKAVLKAIFPSIGFNAVGGRRNYGDSFIAGERGPELIRLDGAGASITSAGTTASQTGGVGSVTVNVINQTGQQVEAKQSQPTFDNLGNLVIDVVLNAVATNKRGMRDVLAEVK